ncbi:FAD-dependent monooxygenase [Nocardioides humi]|uniref:FAD-dependent oxidoreductase n=1 Tax=Nocardioides humi TaxID=449461 RepID=A0ABN2A590_9ACTN|nr:FAD-dependent monooxygenase [Nocardioides humi]
MTTPLDAPFIIVGSGPVGMTLALDLGSRGIPVLLLEQSLDTTTNPRCNTTNARSMEYFRRLGLARRIRRAGLPHDHPTDIVYTTNLSGYELARFPFASTNEVFDRTAAEIDEWPTPELQHRVSQIFLEPILADELDRYESVTVRRGTRVESVEQHRDHVVVHTTDLQSGRARSFTAGHVVGCDGGSSAVRRSIGVQLHGDSRVGERRLSVYFRSDEVPLPGRPGWWYWWHGARYHGAFIQLDGKSLYLCHARVPEGEDLDTADPDVALREALGKDIAHEKIDVVRWTPRRLVADRFRVGRVLLAGDAAHVWLPMGGFGMNTGIGDAMGLGWRLSAIHRGWATDHVLDDFEQERRAVGEATSRAAQQIGDDIENLASDPRLHEDSPQGREIRAKVGQLLVEVDRKQWYSQGVQFGARYVGSAGTAAPTDAPSEEAIGRIDQYQPSSEPGARLPHHWIVEGEEAVFDLLGQGFSILRIGDAPDVGPLTDAARACGVPVTVVDLPASASATYDRHLLLVRPDMYIAWSGDELPDDPRALLDGLRGYGRDDTPLFGSRSEAIA